MMDPYDEFGRVVAYTDGVHIQGTLLWFDAPKCHDIALLSTFPRTRLPRYGTRLIASRGVTKLLAATRSGVHYSTPIVSEYFRSFSIGPHTIEFLPAGCVLGQASIWVLSKEDHSYLYAPHATPVTSSLVHKTELKKSSTLIVNAVNPHLQRQAQKEAGEVGGETSSGEFSGDFEETSKIDLRDKRVELERIVNALVQHHKQYGYFPTLVCYAVGLAQELMHHLAMSGFELSVYSKIYSTSKVYEECGIPLGAYIRYQKKHSGSKVVIASLSTLRRLRALAMEHKSLYFVAHNSESYATYNSWDIFQKSFLVNTESSLADLLETIRIVEPQKVVITGKYISHYKHLLQRHVDKSLGVVFKGAYINNQPTLFDLHPPVMFP